MASGFGILDFAIFGLSLALSASVGIFYAFKDRRQRNGTAEFLMAGRKLPMVPTAFSILTSFLSGILLLAVPAEIYEHGLLMWLYMLAGAFSMLVNALLFLPVLYPLKPVSVYEYFQVRFGSQLLRRVAAVLFILNSLVYVSIAMYAPAVALSAVSKVPTWVFITSVGLVCTFYTTLGGLKAVVWADTLQAVLMYSGVFALLIKGSYDTGGLSNILNIASEEGRISPLTNVNPSPFQFFSVWISTLGGFGFWLAQYGLNQVAVQRYCSLASLNQARTVIAIVIPFYIILVSLACFVGLILVAYFRQCDPRKVGVVSKKDQLVILLVTQALGSISGLPGLFLACLCSGTLSTVSSAINSMSAVLWQDFLKDFTSHKLKIDPNNANVTKIIALCFGLLATGLSFACGPIGGLLKSATNLMGTFAGPIVGLFALGILVPKANKNGALTSALVTVLFLLWICYGNIHYKPFSNYMLQTGDNCSLNSSGPSLTDWRNSPLGDTSVFLFYRVAPWLYPIIGIFMVLVLGSVASLLLPEKAPPRQKVEISLRESSL